MANGFNPTSQLESGPVDVTQFLSTDLQNRGYTASFASDVEAVPEPATWAMMILGVGLIGAGLRRRSAATATA